LLIVTVRDTEDGLLTMVQDLTTGQTGFMTASVANGFAQIAFDPEAKTYFAALRLPPQVRNLE
jgi:hypothetical protein